MKLVYVGCLTKGEIYKSARYRLDATILDQLIRLKKRIIYLEDGRDMLDLLIRFNKTHYLYGGRTQ